MLSDLMVLFAPIRKFSFITMKTEEQAELAIAGLNGHEVLGQLLMVKYRSSRLKVPMF